MRILCPFNMGIVLVLSFGASAAAQMPCANRALPGCTMQLVGAVSRARTLLDSLGALPTPTDAPAVDRPVAVKFSAWLRQSAERMAALAALARKSVRPAAPGARTSLRPYNQQVQALQQQLLEQGNRYSMVSSKLRNRHEMAMSSIRNLK